MIALQQRMRAMRQAGDEGIGMLLIITALGVLAAYGLLSGRHGTGAPGEAPDLRPVTD